MNTIRLIRTELKKIITSPIFYASIALSCILFLSSELYYDYSSNHGVSIIEAMFRKSKKDYMSSTQYCSYSVISKCSGVWLKMFAPVIASFSYIPILCCERDTNNMRFIKSRLSKTSYNTGVFITAMVSGGLILVISFLLFFLSVVAVFPSIYDYSGDERSMFESWIYDTYPLFEKLGYTYLIALKLIELFIFGAMSALPAIVFTGIIRNKYFIVTFPFFLKYIFSQIYSKLYGKVYSDIENPNEKLRKFLDITDLNVTVNLFSQKGQIIKIVILNLIIITIAYVIFYIAMNRRIDYGE